MRVVVSDLGQISRVLDLLLDFREHKATYTQNFAPEKSF